MYSRARILIIHLMVLGALGLAGAATPQPVVNGNFEGGFFHDPNGDHATPAGWSSFVLQGAPKHMGFWTPANHSPNWSHTIYESNYIAGIYQQVSGTVPGNQYRASAWVKAFNHDVEFWIGIDPLGGTDPTRVDYMPVPEIPGNNWTPLSHQVQAQATSITVFVQVHNSSPGNRNGWIDDVALTDEGPGGPAPMGSISGTVRDTSSQPIAGASVLAGGLQASTESDGTYNLGLPVGTYDVSAIRDGFESRTVQGIDVTGGGNRTVDFILTRIPPPNSPPTAVAGAQPTSGSPPLQVQFTGSQSVDPDGDPLSYRWDFADSSSPSTEPNPAHVFAAEGSFRVTLEVSDGRGGSDTDEVIITLGSATNRITNGDFSRGFSGWSLWEERGSLNPRIDGAGRLAVSGSGHNGGLYQQFPTGGAGTDISVTGLWATGPTVSGAQWAEVIIINGPRLPVNGADVHGGQSDVVMVYKNDTWATPPGWSGTMSDTAAVVNNGTFTAQGDIAAIVLKSGNLPGVFSGTLFDEIVVSGGGTTPPPENQAPQAVAHASPTSGTAPLSVSFDAAASSDPDGDPLTYVWDFGDGQQGTGAIVSHVYGSAGSFEATLTLTDGQGGSDHAAITIVVSEPGGPQEPIEWDDRLTQLGILLIDADVASGAGYWKLVQARFESDGDILPPPGGGSESDGKHAVYYKTLDINDNPIEGQKVVTSWPTGNPTTAVEHYTKGPGIDDYWGNFPLPGGWCPFYPDGGRGPFGAYVGDAPSDQVWGMGLPCNRHVSYRLTWQFTIKP